MVDEGCGGCAGGAVGWVAEEDAEGIGFESFRGFNRGFEVFYRGVLLRIPAFGDGGDAAVAGLEFDFELAGVGFGFDEVAGFRGFETVDGCLDSGDFVSGGVVEELEDVPAEGAEAVGVEAEHVGIMTPRGSSDGSLEKYFAV